MASCPRLHPPRHTAGGPFFFVAKKLESDAAFVAATITAGGTIPHCSGDGAASILKSGLEIKNQCTKEGVNGEKLTSIPKFGPEIKNRCTKEGVNGEKLTSIPKFGPEIKNQCTQEAVNGEILASILKSGLEFKNQCTQEAGNEEILASILKFGHEIKNRCRKQHIPPARVPSRVDDESCLGGFACCGLDAGSTVAAKAGADAPGGGISLCFCRRGRAAPA